MSIKKSAVVFLLFSSFMSSTAFSQDAMLGEIKLVGFNFAPRGYADTNGQLLAISQNSALFSLLGTMYGGDGRTTFALPDLRGRSAIHTGQGPGLSNYSQGSKSGAETMTLGINNMPSHSHTATAHASSAEGDTDDPTANSWAKLDRTDIYGTAAPDVAMKPGSVTVANTGNGQSFNIRSPYLTLRYIIALQGTFPSRN